MNKKLVEAQRPRREYMEQMMRESRYLRLYLVYLLHEEAKVTICIIIVPIPCTVLYSYSIVYSSVRLNTTCVANCMGYNPYVTHFLCIHTALGSG